MTTLQEGWSETHGGLAYPPIRRNPSLGPQEPNDWIGGGYSSDLLEAVRGEFDGAMSSFMEQISPGNVSGDALGAQSWQREQGFGDSGIPSGATEEVLRLLAERLTAVHSNIYGGQYGYGFGLSENEVGDIIRQLSAIIWVFPEYNPLIKQMVDLRGLYCFAQGFEIRGESKRKKKARLRAIRQRKEQMKMEREAMQQSAMAAIAGAGPEGNGGSTNGNGGSASGSSGGAAGGGGPNNLARNALYQRYGGTGRSSSIPGGAREQSREKVLEEFDEALSGAGGGQQGSREPSGTQYRTFGSDEESPIAEIVREFWEDPCNIDRLCGVEALHRLDRQCEIEGNSFIVLRNKGKDKMPVITVWPTFAIQSVIVDDLDDGTGIELGYVASPPTKRDATTGSTNSQIAREIYPSMVADDVERLKLVLEAHAVKNIKINEDARIYHIKEWGPTFRSFGIPGIMASLASATRYMSFTSEWVTMQRVWRTYAMLITGYGNNKGLNQIGANFANRVATIFSGAAAGAAGAGTQNAGGMPATPPIGLAAMSGMSPGGMAGTRIEPVRTAGSADPPAMGREIRLLGEMGMGYPDNMFSDTNTGTMSRADVLERNTHLKFLMRQQVYTNVFKCISKQVVKMQLGEESMKDTDVVVSWPAIVTPSSVEQSSMLSTLYQGDGIPKKVYVEESLKLLKRTDLHEIMTVLFPADEDGLELKSDADLDTMNAMQMGDQGQSEPSDPNNPLAGQEAEIEYSLYGEDRFFG